MLASNDLNHKPNVEIIAEMAGPLWEQEHAFFVNFACWHLPTEGDISVTVGPGVLFNDITPWGWVLAHPYERFIEVKPVLTKEQAEKKWDLILSHASAPSLLAPIAIDVNGITIANHFSPPLNAWKDDYFSISLNEGENTIKIRLLDANTDYWIHKLYLDPLEE